MPTTGVERIQDLAHYLTAGPAAAKRIIDERCGKAYNEAVGGEERDVAYAQSVSAALMELINDCHNREVRDLLHHWNGKFTSLFPSRPRRPW